MVFKGRVAILLTYHYFTKECRQFKYNGGFIDVKEKHVLCLQDSHDCNFHFLNLEIFKLVKACFLPCKCVISSLKVSKAYFYSAVLAKVFEITLKEN